jgi:hypothetical protein
MMDEIRTQAHITRPDPVHIPNTRRLEALAQVMKIGITKVRGRAAEALGVQIRVTTLKGRWGPRAPPDPNRVETRIRANKASLPIKPKRVPEPISIVQTVATIIRIWVTMFIAHTGTAVIQECGFTARNGKS